MKKIIPIVIIAAVVITILYFVFRSKTVTLQPVTAPPPRVVAQQNAQLSVFKYKTFNPQTLTVSFSNPNVNIPLSATITGVEKDGSTVASSQSYVNVSDHEIVYVRGENGIITIQYTNYNTQQVVNYILKVSPFSIRRA